MFGVKDKIMSLKQTQQGIIINQRMSKMIVQWELVILSLISSFVLL